MLRTASRSVRTATSFFTTPSRALSTSLATPHTTANRILPSRTSSQLSAPTRLAGASSALLTTPSRARSTGIVGLPNVGKSTFFNALSSSTTGAETGNFPFCTVNANSARVAIRDQRLEQLAAVADSDKLVPSFLEFVDIAGLIRGAHEGAGLGNQFLGNIRNVDLLLHVVRAFEDPDVVHVDSHVDPVADAEVIETELLLADLQSVDKRLQKMRKKRQHADRETREVIDLLEVCHTHLDAGTALRDVEWTDDQTALLPSLQLITSRPMIYVANVDADSASEGNEYTQALQARADEMGCECLMVCASVEEEMIEMDEESKQEYMELVGIEETSLERVVQSSARILDLMPFYTIGPKEAHSWLIVNGMHANEAAGKIHSDMQRGFIKAEVIKPTDFIELGSESAVRAEGKVLQVGKEYVVEDGDILNIKFAV